jgi:hypothetical protein
VKGRPLAVSILATALALACISACGGRTTECSHSACSEFAPTTVDASVDAAPSDAPIEDRADVLSYDGGTAPCQAPGKTIYVTVDNDSIGRPEPREYVQRDHPSWSVGFHPVRFSASVQGKAGYLELSLEPAEGSELAEGTFATTGLWGRGATASMNVKAASVGCSDSRARGSFTIEELVTMPTTTGIPRLRRILVSFVQHCTNYEGNLTFRTYRGCLRVDEP